MAATTRSRALLAQSNDAKLADAIRAQGSTYLGYSFSALGLKRSGSQDLTGFRKTFLEPRPLFYNIVTKAAGANDTTIEADAYLPPIPVLNSAARGTAYVNIDLDSDGEARSYPTVIRFNQRYCVPLFLAARRCLCTACADSACISTPTVSPSLSARRQPDSSR